MPNIYPINLKSGFWHYAKIKFSCFSGIKFRPVFIVTLLCLLIGGLFAPSAPCAKKIVIFDMTGCAQDRIHILVHLIGEKWEVSDEEGEEVLNQWYIADEPFDHQWWEDYAVSKGKTVPIHWMEQFKEAWQEVTSSIPGLLVLVKQLQEQGYKTALLSYGNALQKEVIKKTGYSKILSPVISSAPHDVKSYRALLKKLHTTATACVFIDNRQENLKNARKAGIDAIDFISIPELYEELEKREIFLPFNRSEMLFFID